MTTRRILFVYAHPDDESFWGAGIAARYTKEGAHVGLVIATRGERGTTGTPPRCSIEQLPQVRQAEVVEAARAAGFSDLTFLHYEDQRLSDAPGDEVREALVRIIRQARPTVVVTFDPEGVNRHPDHIAISRFTSDAAAAAGDARWYPDAIPSHTVTRLLWTPPVLPWQTAVADLGDRAGVDFVIDTSRHWRERAAALAAHRTQRHGIDKLFFTRPDFQQILEVEVFRQAWGPSLSTRPATDLFAGI